jgi:hypothetical protein
MSNLNNNDLISWTSTTDGATITSTGSSIISISDGGYSTNIDWTISGAATYTTPGGTEVNIKQGVHPTLVFKLWKKKLGVIPNYKYSRRIKRVKALAQKYLKLGHYALSDKFLAKISYETRMSEIYASGIKMFLPKSLIDKYKYKIRNGHIADTLFEKYTNPIPDNILILKKELEKRKVLDSFVIYHYWNEKLEEKKEKKQPRSDEEKLAMRDPILFGICKDIPDKLFFIADWDDDYCDLTFDEMIDKIPLKDKDIEVPLNPEKF